MQQRPQYTPIQIGLFIIAVLGSLGTVSGWTSAVTQARNNYELTNILGRLKNHEVAIIEGERERAALRLQLGELATELRKDITYIRESLSTLVKEHK